MQSEKEEEEESKKREAAQCVRKGQRRKIDMGTNGHNAQSKKEI